jgi:tellurite resistance protein
LVWLSLATLYGAVGFEIVGYVFAGIGALVFTLCCVAYCIKGLKHPAAVKDEWNHPFKVNLFGYISLNILVFSAVAAFFNQILTQILFYTGTVLQLFLVFLTALRWVKIANGLNNINPSYFIPIAGLAFIPVPAEGAGIAEFGWLILGAAMVYWVLMFALIFLRIFFVGPLARSSLPMMFMIVTPPALITIAYMTLAAPIVANPGNGTAGVPMDTFAKLLYGITLFNTALFTILRIGTPRVPFMLVHWSYVFPLAMFSVATQRYAAGLQANFSLNLVGASSNALATLLVTVSIIAVSVFWIWAVIMTMFYGFRKKLVARESKVLSEETANKVYQGKISSSSGSYRGSSRGTERDSEV